MSTDTRPSFAASLRAALLGGAIAAALNLVLAVAAPALGIALVGQFNPNAAPMPLPAAMVIGACVVPAIVAGVAYFGLSRVTDKAPRIFTVVATLLLLVSMGGPATLVGADAATKSVLAAMHVIAAVAIIRSLQGLRAA